MRVLVYGNVVDVEVRKYTGADGEVRSVFDAYLASDNPRYGASRISGPADLAPDKGERVEYVASVSAKSGKRGPWLSVWCVERVNAPAAKAS